MTKHNYCMKCAALILQKAKLELDGLAHEWGRQDDLLLKVIETGQDL